MLCGPNERLCGPCPPPNRLQTLIGFYVKRQECSHMILRRDEPFAQIVAPDHRELDRGTLRAIIRQAGLCVDEFVKLL